MSSATPNIGLTKMATGETIGAWSDANNGSGGNLDIIDTKMGPVGATSLQAQVDSLNSKKVTGVNFSITSNSPLNITMENNSRITLLCASAYTSHCGIIILSCTSTGVADFFVLVGASGLTLTKSGATVTITSTNGVNGTAIIHAGSITA